MSKEKVIAAFEKKTKTIDAESETMKKQIFKSETNFGNLLTEYMKKRNDFHKYSLLKVKVK